MHRRLIPGLLLVAALALTGCGSSLVKTEGVVTLDGQPVEGATVTFMTEDGKQTSVGATDASGKFQLFTADKPGALPGSYKVTVVKTPKVAGAESMSPGNPEYLKQMKEESKDTMAASKKSAAFAKMPGLAAGGGAASIKSELPKIYGTPASTPLTAKVPSDGPITLELKSK
jgi:hypothetical protein